MALERMDVHQFRWIEAGVVQEHLARYDFAANQLRGDRVLDCACGTGYGTKRLADKVADTIGIDLSAETVAINRTKYPGVAFETGDASDLPFPDASFDTVVSFETIEHIPAPRIELAIAQFARVLKPGGRLIISTPERVSYSLNGPTGNQFHDTEFNQAEFEGLLAPYFSIDAVYGQKFSRRMSLGAANIASGIVGHAIASKLWRGYKMVICRDNKPVLLYEKPSQVPMILIMIATKRPA